ncbi:MAG: hypothetical protein ACFWTZ_01735 [Burkholderia sp.]|jgi:hypothetical protein
MISRRTLLSIPFMLALGGCATDGANSSAEASSDAAGIVLPKIYPDFSIGETLSAEQVLSFKFSRDAIADGAPAHLPPLSSRLVLKGDSLEMAISEKDVSVWHIHASPSGIQESRNPILDSHVQAQNLLRDITFCLWPEESLRNIIEKAGPCRGGESLRLVVGKDSRRLYAGSRIALEMQKRGSVTTLKSHTEGYALRMQTMA